MYNILRYDKFTKKGKICAHIKMINQKLVFQEKRY